MPNKSPKQLQLKSSDYVLSLYLISMRIEILKRTMNILKSHISHIVIPKQEWENSFRVLHVSTFPKVFVWFRPTENGISLLGKTPLFRCNVSPS